MGMRSATRSAVLVAAILAVSIGVAAPASSAAPRWSKPVTLGPISRDSKPPQIAVAPDGEAVVTWEGGRPNGIRVTSRRPGHRWQRPTLLAPAHESTPQVAVSRQKAVVVWDSVIRPEESEAQVIFAATRLRGGRWGKPENISAEKRWRREPEGRDPEVAITNRGEAIAMWTAGDEGHSTTPFIRTASQPLGGGWTTPLGLRGSIEGQEPQVGVTPKGEAVAVWHAFYNEESGLYVASRPVGEKWSIKGLSSPGAFPEPKLAITPKGEAVAVWGLEYPGRGLQVATRRPGQRWGVETIPAAEFERLSFTQIVTKPGGEAVVWIRNISGEGEDVRVASHRRDGGWTEQASLFGEEVKDRRPEIVVTRSGEWVAVWESSGPGGKFIQTASKPAGGSWSAPVNLTPSPPAHRAGNSAPKIAVAPSGEVTAVWWSYDGSVRTLEAATRRP
jgi:hypothetical protein